MDDFTNKNSIKHIARTLRPKKFCEIIGQEKWVKFIQTALKNDLMLPVCIIFGPSGVGKTTIARLIAMWESCTKKADNEPCGQCENCIAIINDCHPDVIEFDGGTYTGVEDLKLILENIRYRTVLSVKRIYILDEVHMLSRNAISSLLKLFETDLSNVQFIMATTNQEKIPETIMSRGFRIPLDPIMPHNIAQYLIKISQETNYHLEEVAGLLIANASKGSMRQAVSTLEQSFILYGNNINKSMIEEMLGLESDAFVGDVLEKIEQLKMEDVMNLLSKVSNPMNFVRQLLELIKSKIISKSASSRLINIGFNLAEASIVIHRSPCKNLLEIIIGKIIMDEIGAPPVKLSSLAKDLFKL